MKQYGWCGLVLLLLAACAPLQMGLEPGTPTAVAAVTSTAPASATPEPSATRTPLRTAVVSTVTATHTPRASATLPATATASPEPASPIPAFTATRRPPSPTTPPPTATEPVPTPPDPVEIQLTSFTTDRTEADPGETITLSWTSQNAATVTLVTGVPGANGQLTFTVLAVGLPPEGIFVANIENIAPAQLFQLTPVGSDMLNGPPLQLSIARRHCPETYAFVFPAGRYNCAATASQFAPMVEQVFEHGRLLRVAVNNWVNPRSQPIIFVMNSSGGWVSRTDAWVDGEPESDPALVPPEGLHQPVRGFGKLWREEFRAVLGWAVAPEQPYTGAFQEGWTPQPGYEIAAPGWYAKDIYLRLANNDVVRFVWSSRFNGQTWELLPQ